jgi:hypothetical protein
LEFPLSPSRRDPFGVANRPCFIATKADVEGHFSTHGTGEITEIKLMNGFGFIEYKDSMDARDVVPGTYFRNVVKKFQANLLLSLPYVTSHSHDIFVEIIHDQLILTTSRWLHLHGRTLGCAVCPRRTP